MRAFAVGDVHGRYDLFYAMMTIINEQREEGDWVILMGDYVDRGPESKAVVEYIREWQKQPCNIALRGNHEELMYMGIGVWYENGGQATEDSFGGKVPQDVKQWAVSLPSFIELGAVFFSHANPDPYKALTKQAQGDNFTWNREKRPWEHSFPHHMVFGHTPQWTEAEKGLARYSLSSKHTNVDTGAFKTGVLTCGVFDLIKGRRVEMISIVSRQGELYVEQEVEPEPYS